MKGRDEIVRDCLIMVQERAFLEGLVAILPDGARVINIGAQSGCSTIAMLRGGRDIEDFYLYSIDIRPQPEEMEYALDCGLADPQRFGQICQDSKVVGQHWSEDIHLVFIDGDHSYDGCMGDIEAWEPHIVEDGYLVFHDYGYANPSVTQAVDDWFEEAVRRGWYKIGRVDISVAFKWGKPDPRLPWHPDTITGKFMRGVE